MWGDVWLTVFAIEIKRAFYFHRDIKAGNILLGDDGTVQIAGDIFTAQTLEFTGQITFFFYLNSFFNTTQLEIFIFYKFICYE